MRKQLSIALGSDGPRKVERGRFPFRADASIYLRFWIASDVDERIRESSSLRSLLHIAAGAGKVNTVRLLLQSGADACSHDWRASTPLHYAAEGFPEVVSLLCEHAMDLVDAKNADGDTPLHLACISQSYDSALQLLQTAADPNIENNEGAVPPQQLRETRESSSF